MQVTREDLNPCTIQLAIVCSQDQVREGFARAYKNLAKKIRVPGFRPGQAPQAVVQKLVGKEELNNEAADLIVSKAFKEALEQQDLKPENRPAVTLNALDEGELKCEFTVKVPLAPKVEMAEYKGLEVEKPAVEVTDEEAEQYLQEIRRRSGKREAVTGRGIQEGDYAVVNVKVKGEEGDGRTFMTIAGQTFAELDQAILGMSAEEMKSLELPFPASFQEKDWAGKTLACQVTIRSVNAVKLPEVDDEFAKSLEAANVEDLKVRLRDRIKEAKEQMAQETVNDRLLDKLIEQSSIQVADTTWESVVVQRMREILLDLQQRNVTLEKYCEQNGMTQDQFKEALEREAKTHVVRAVVIEHIFREEKMQITNQEAQRHFLEIAGENGVKQEDLRQFTKKYGAQVRDEVVFRAMYAKVTKFLTEHAKLVEAAPEPAVKPARRGGKDQDKPEE